MEEKKTPQQKYYEANKEKIAAQRKARYEANKELFKEKREKNKEFQREYQKKYRESKTDDLKEYQKKYYETNKDKRNQYLLENKDKISEYRKTYYEENQDKLIDLRKQYYQGNKETEIQRVKEYYSKNKEKYKEYNKLYSNQRYHNDVMYNLKHTLRNLINKSITRKGGVKVSKTELILGCSYETFKQHIESLWSHPDNLDENGNVWMTWENKGNPKDGIFEPNKNWDIDHKIPLSQTDSVDEVIKLNHYTNLQPMCGYRNRWIKKGE